MGVDEARLSILDGAGDFAKLCRAETSKYEGIDLAMAICDLASELVDAGFDEIEIIKSFEVAVATIPKYSRGV